MVLYKREFLAFVRPLLLRAIFRSHLPSSTRGKEIYISGRFISGIPIHTSLWLCRLRV